MSTTLDERRVVAWNDSDRDSAWSMYTLCRGCAHMAFCRGKERDLVRCWDCYVGDVPAVPLIELGLCTYTGTASAKQAHARGVAMLEERKREAAEARRRNLEEARKRGAEERAKRDAEILRLVAEGEPYEVVAERFGLKPSTIKKMAEVRREGCGSRPHGCAGKSAEIRGFVGEPSLPPILGQEGLISVVSSQAREKRKKTFQSRAERQRLEVWEMRDRGFVIAQISDRMGISDRTVRAHLAARKKLAASPTRKAA